jgi:hypothetical protein
MGKTPAPADLKEARVVLDYLVHDLIVSHQLYDLFLDIGARAPVRAETEKAVRRWYVSGLILTLCKVSEFIGRYKWLVPANHQSTFRSLERELSRRGIKRLRNTFIGHIYDKKTGRPITEVELNAAFNAATDNDLGAFLRWIHVSGSAPTPGTVVGILQGVHEALGGQRGA